MVCGISHKYQKNQDDTGLLTALYFTKLTKKGARGIFIETGRFFITCKKNPMRRIACLLTVLIMLLVSCSTETGKDVVLLDTGWKFSTGDDMTWGNPSFNDSGWDNINPMETWEKQGHKKYDGFAWYRIRQVIPRSMIKTAFLKDSIIFRLGKIDDCDQVFLNGALIGENGTTMAMNSLPSADFNKIWGKWDLNRNYVLSVNDPRIQWDKENVIAVRVFDFSGPGGMFSQPFEIAMPGLKDYVRFDLTSSPYDFEGENILKKNIVIKNISGKNEFKGNLVIRAVEQEGGIGLYTEKTGIDLTPGLIIDKQISFKTSFDKAVNLFICFTEATTGKQICDTVDVPRILTPKPPKGPRITGAKVFGVRPWSPFQFKVTATGEGRLKYTALDLPAGLKINEDDGVITGVLKKKGEFIVKLKVENHLGFCERDLKIVVGDVISLTPPLGWNSWNCWGLSVSDEKIRQSADAMKSSGLSDHGWTYINIDDGWEYMHDKDGNILTNSKFPNMRALCDYVHSLGLKIGIYSSPGRKTCGGYEGSLGFEEKDVQHYAAWGIDYLKYDWCSYSEVAPDPTPEQLKYPYQVMRRALRNVNRDIHYSLCQYGMGDVWKWGASVDGNSWRTTGDIEDTWESLSLIGFSQDKCSPYSAPGRWNDPDMLVVGRVGWGPSLHNTRLTPEEQYTHITLWSLLASPLLIGCDLTQLDAFTLSLLTNDEVLAVNQDPLGKQAIQVKKTGEYEIWIRDLEDGSKAVGLFNKTEKAMNIPVEMKALTLDGKCQMRDLWVQKDLGQVCRHFEMKTWPHGARLIRLSK